LFGKIPKEESSDIIQLPNAFREELFVVLE
jgi:hypothetical protein